MFLSAVTVAEIQAGIETSIDQDKVKALELEAWLDKIITSHAVLPMDAAVSREWARLKHRKSDNLYEDAMIAATARIHHLTVVTRNVQDFLNFEVKIFNPFESK